MQGGDDTIFALASAAGQAGVAVIRVSGPAAVVGYRKLTNKSEIPEPRQAVYTSLFAADQTVIDRGIALYFKGPASYTGEDVIEYTVHGSRAVIARMLSELGNLSGHRMAEPGEFTKRAFMNGKMDLTAAEAVADLIHAETEAQRILALDQLGGRLAVLYRDWGERLKKLLAHQEAEIEFPDEDMPDGIDASVITAVEQLMTEIDNHLRDERRGERLREGLQIAIVGAPNAGKSSLLNALARRDAAIVSETAGTTRDIVEVSLNLGGYPVVISDTAGLRDDHADEIEAEGIRRAISRAGDADLKIAVFDAGMAPDFDAATRQVIDARTFIVINKTDVSSISGSVDFTDFYPLSLITEDGLDDFLTALAARVRDFFTAGGGAPVLTRERHRENLKNCHDSLTAALSAPLSELAAEDLRQAMLALGRITGRVDVEQLLDVVFRDFCIGK